LIEETGGAIGAGKPPGGANAGLVRGETPCNGEWPMGGIIEPIPIGGGGIMGPGIVEIGKLGLAIMLSGMNGPPK
jgi:hypothetical protein